MTVVCQRCFNDSVPVSVHSWTGTMPNPTMLFEASRPRA
ncbi:hypothetical protein BSU04_20020 [Caballeronia sordidicola]|uniref:Uncharacterized protein n=1 Tax=Caballeronia sordidicola TaxID=196367 RepID=A0A226X053_CABSO|nr:hypothetical protein BSU04_20020 [Caballeronia sordidicola]